MGNTFTEEDKEKIQNHLNNLYQPETEEDVTGPRVAVATLAKRANTTPVSTLEERTGPVSASAPSLGLPSSQPRPIPVSRVTEQRGDQSKVTMRPRPGQPPSPDMFDSGSQTRPLSQAFSQLNWDTEASIHTGDGVNTDQLAAQQLWDMDMSVHTGDTANAVAQGLNTNIQQYDPLGVALLPRGGPHGGARTNKRAKRDGGLPPN